jgi:hypothetical protein
MQNIILQNKTSDVFSFFHDACILCRSTANEAYLINKKQFPNAMTAVCERRYNCA